MWKQEETPNSWIRWMCLVISICVLPPPVSSSIQTNFLSNICSTSAGSVTCVCSFTNNLYKVNCSGLSLQEIPDGIPTHTSILFFSNNQITGLRHGDFPSLTSLQTLYLSNNRIKTIEAGTFDNLYNLHTINLQNNEIPKIDSGMFRFLPQLTVLDLSYNWIERIQGDTFLTLPSIQNIGLADNPLQCDCETRKFKQWLDTVVSMGVMVLDAKCANKQNLPIYDVTDYGGCTGRDLFSTDLVCGGCPGVKSDRECNNTLSKHVCTDLKPACYTQVFFTANGLQLYKGCDKYLTCIQRSKTSNTNTCYNDTSNVRCQFCCIGNYCNQENLGGRTKTLVFGVVVTLDGDITSNQLEPGAPQYNTLMDQALMVMQNNLVNQSLGTYHVIIETIRTPKITIMATIECSTILDISEISIYNSLDSQLTKVQQINMYNIDEMRITHTVLCPKETVTSSKGTFTWSASEIGETKRLICPNYGTNKEYAYRYCTQKNNKAEWSSMDDSACLDVTTTTTTLPPPSVNTTVQLKILSEKTVTDSNADQIAKELADISDDSENYSSTDVDLTVDVLERLVTLPSTPSSIPRKTDIAVAMSNFLDSPEVALSKAQRETRGPSRFLQTVDTLVNRADVDVSELTAVNPNLALFARQSSSSQFNGYAIQANHEPGQKFKSDSILVVEGVQQVNGSSSLILPATLTQSLSANQRAEISKVTFAVFAEGKLFTAISQVQPLSSNQEVSDSLNYVRGPNSLVMAASVPNVEVANLRNPVLLRFSHVDKNSGNAECVFWNESTTAESKWSTRGCYLLESVENSHTTCACDHLTNFALLMDIYGTGEELSDANKQAMAFISYIGCGISLFGLLLTLITYGMFRKLRSSNPSKILINLCIALTATNVVFLLGQQNYTLRSLTGCKIVAIILHYFLLSAMTWMAVEAFYMYLALVKIFNTYISRFVLKTCLVGYGVPLVIVVVTVGTNKSENYGLQPGDICWLAPIPFYSAFLGPVLLVLVLNTIAFVLVTRQLCGISSRKITKSDKSSTLSRLRGAVGVIILLGLTWIFAIFAVKGTGGLIVQYLFLICNSLQGLFIFIFYCFLNKDARKHWIRILPCFDTSDEKGSLQTSKEAKAKQYIAGYNSSGSSSSTGRNSSGDFSDISRNTSDTDIAEKFRSEDGETRGRYPSYTDSSI